jgi:hypothetical protein
VEWRDLDARAWEAVMRLPGGRSIRVRDTARIRASSLWLRATELVASASFLDFPGGLIDVLLAETASAWTHRASFVLHPTDRPASVVLGRSPDPQVIEGRAADLASWTKGRPPRRLSSDRPIPASPAAAS